MTRLSVRRPAATLALSLATGSTLAGGRIEGSMAFEPRAESVQIGCLPAEANEKTLAVTRE